ncbi:MAG: metalloregulator ArsR/SmtB family transcription factor [Knoellia sp.]
MSQPDAFSAAAEPARRRILHLLAGGPRSVKDIAVEFTSTRSATSQHLGVLFDAGLVRSEKSGRQRIYSIRPDGIARLRREIDRFWTDELDQLLHDAHNLASGRSPSPSARETPS